MKKKKFKKLTLNRETLRLLEEPSLHNAAGALVAENGDVAVITKSWIRCPISWQSNCLSICICTVPLDGCPDPTVV